MNGVDVGRKVVILGRLLGLDLDINSLPIQNIVPKELQGVSLSEFETQLPAFNAEFGKLNTEALKEGKVLRYVGVITPERSCVELRKYDAGHAFASLKGSDNVFRIVSERFPNGLTIQGSGAGAGVTAFGIFSDVLSIMRCI